MIRNILIADAKAITDIYNSYKEIEYKFNTRIDVSYWQLFINKK